MYRVIVCCAQEALSLELRERLTGTYAVQVQNERLGNQSCLPGSTSVRFTCGGGGVAKRLLRGVARVLLNLQTQGPSQNELLVAVRVCCERLRKEKSTLLGAVGQLT